MCTRIHAHKTIWDLTQTAAPAVHRSFFFVDVHHVAPSSKLLQAKLGNPDGYLLTAENSYQTNDPMAVCVCECVCVLDTTTPQAQRYVCVMDALHTILYLGV